MARMRILDLPVDRVAAELVVVPFFSDQRPLEGPAALLDWRLNGLLTRQIRRGETYGRFGDRYLVKGNHKVAAEWVMFVGCDDAAGFTPDGAARVVGELLKSSVQAGFRQVGVGFPTLRADSAPVWQEQLKEALRTVEIHPFECLLSACDPLEYVN